MSKLVSRFRESAQERRKTDNDAVIAAAQTDRVFSALLLSAHLPALLTDPDAKPFRQEFLRLLKELEAGNWQSSGPSHNRFVRNNLDRRTAGSTKLAALEAIIGGPQRAHRAHARPQLSQAPVHPHVAACYSLHLVPLVRPKRANGPRG